MPCDSAGGQSFQLDSSGSYAAEICLICLSLTLGSAERRPGARWGRQARLRASFDTKSTLGKNMAQNWSSGITRASRVKPWRSCQPIAKKRERQKEERLRNVTVKEKRSMSRVKSSCQIPNPTVVASVGSQKRTEKLYGTDLSAWL